MRSSTTPPLGSQHSVYCAWPGPIRRRSLLRQVVRKSTAPRPRTLALPRCDTSQRAAAPRLTPRPPPPPRHTRVEPPPAAVLQRHLPAAERGELRAEGGLPVVQRRAAHN